MPGETVDFGIDAGGNRLSFWGMVKKEFLRYWRGRVKESFMKARVKCESIAFVLFLISGLVLIKSPSFPIDRTTWVCVFSAFVVVFLVELCFVSPYAHAQALQSQIAAFEQRTKPKIKVSGDMAAENCLISAGDAWFFRARLDSLGIDPICNVEANIIALREDGIPVELGEFPRLMMHPGTPTLPALKYQVPGFIDIVRTDQNRQPMLALAWDYASVDALVIGSEKNCEIDIAISSISAPTQKFTVEFRWSGHPLTSAFKTREA